MCTIKKCGYTMALVLYLTLPNTGFLNNYIKFASGLSSFQDQHMHSCMQPEALRHCFSSSLWGMTTHLKANSERKKSQTNQKNKSLSSKTGKPKLTFHYCNVLGYRNILLVTKQILEKLHLANSMVVQCTCHWHYAQVCKSLFHFSRRNVTIWNLHLPCINRDTELCSAMVSTATDFC